MKFLTIILISTFIYQNILYKTHLKNNKENTKTLEIENSKEIATNFQIEEIEQKEDKEKIYIQQDCWNCTLLFLGANFGPSFLINKEYYRIFSSFFLHENIYHLLINILTILYYFERDKENKFFKKRIFFLFFFFTLINGNLLSNFLYPDFLKIGSSLLSVVFITFSFLENFGNFNFYFFIDFFMISLLVFGIFNKNIDNFLHFFGIFSTLLFWRYKDSYKNLTYFFILSFLMIIFSFFFINQNFELDEEDLETLKTNFGCDIFLKINK